MKNLQRLAAIIFLSLMLLACSGGTSAESESSGSADAAPSGQFPLMGVAELDQYLADNKGKATMLMFWTTWCPSCKQAMPDLEKLGDTHGDQVNVITISLDDKREALDNYFKTRKQILPVYFGDQAVASKFGVEAIPTMVFFDKEGNAVFAKAGGFPYDMLVAMAQKLSE